MKLGKLEVTWGFVLLAAWLNYLDRQFILPMAALACLFHELGHLAALHWLNVPVRSLRLTCVGAEISLGRAMGYWQEGLAALAGPGVNLLAAVIFSGAAWGRVFAGLNLVLGIFNLIPLGRLDGGRALSCTLALLFGPETAQQVLFAISVGLTGSLLGLGLFLWRAGNNLTLFVVALWLTAGFLGKKEMI